MLMKRDAKMLIRAVANTVANTVVNTVSNTVANTVARFKKKCNSTEINIIKMINIYFFLVELYNQIT